MAAGRKVVEYSYKKMFEIGGEPRGHGIPARGPATVSCNRGTRSECCQPAPCAPSPAPVLAPFRRCACRNVHYLRPVHRHLVRGEPVAVRPRCALALRAVSWLHSRDGILRRQAGASARSPRLMPHPPSPCPLASAQIRSYIYNPDVRRARADLHEELPGERTAKVGAAWHAYHDKRHIRNECGNVSVWRALGFDRPDPVEEYFPGATKRA